MTHLDEFCLKNLPKTNIIVIFAASLRQKCSSFIVTMKYNEHFFITNKIYNIMKCDVIVETCRNSFSCFMQNSENLSYRLIGEGKTVRKAIEDFFIARDEMKQMYEEEGRQFVEPEWNFIFDVGAFLDYYPINVTAFAKYSGINASLLRQYASGLAKPKQKNIERIRKALDTVGRNRWKQRTH